MLAIKRRIGTSPGPLAMRGTVRPRYSAKMLCYLCHLCQILNRLQQLNRRFLTAVQAILNVAFPIFGVILAGYLAGRFRILGGEATAALNAFVSTFALPVLFFGTLARAPVGAVFDPGLVAGFGIVVVATFLVGMASTRLVARRGLAAMSLQGIAASWGNVGYMGVPLCLAAFGEAGLPPPMLTIIITAITSMIAGVMLIELEVAAGHGPLKTFLPPSWRAA